MPEGGFALGGAVPGCRPAFRPRTRSPRRARTHALRAKTLRCLRPNDHSVPISSPRRLAILFRRCVAASTCAKQALGFVQKCVGSGLSARLGQRSWCLPCRPSLIQWRRESNSATCNPPPLLVRPTQAQCHTYPVAVVWLKGILFRRRRNEGRHLHAALSPYGGIIARRGQPPRY